MTRREEHLVSYGAALFEIYLMAPRLTDLDCYWCDPRRAVLYGFGPSDEFLIAAEFELEQETAEADFSPWPYVEGFHERMAKQAGGQGSACRRMSEFHENGTSNYG